MAEGVILPMVGQGWPEPTMSGENLSLKQLVPPDATTPWTRMRVAKLVFAASLVREMVGVGPLTLWFRELTERPEYRYLEGYEAGLRDLCHAVGGTWWLYGRGRPYSLTEAQLGYHLAAVHYYVTHRYRLPVETTSGRVWDESVWPRDATTCKFDTNPCFEVIRRRQLLQRTQALVALDLGWPEEQWRARQPATSQRLRFTLTSTTARGEEVLRVDVNPLVTPLQGGWFQELEPRAMKLGSDLEVQAAANRKREAAAGGPRDKDPAAALQGLSTIRALHGRAQHRLADTEFPPVLRAVSALGLPMRPASTPVPTPCSPIVPANLPSTLTNTSSRSSEAKLVSLLTMYMKVQATCLVTSATPRFA
jgi:hypothetical protein